MDQNFGLLRIINANLMSLATILKCLSFDYVQNNPKLQKVKAKLVQNEGAAT